MTAPGQSICLADVKTPFPHSFKVLHNGKPVAADLVVEKTLNDAFAGTSLQATLTEIGPGRLLIAGWATDFCVDATVRSAVSHDYDVVVVGDGHTLNDRPHLDASAVIRHHNWVWSNLVTNRSIRLAAAAELLAEGNGRV